MKLKNVRLVLAGSVFLLAALVMAAVMSGRDGGMATAVAADPSADITVYKSPTCGCCTAWIEHLEENGFTVASVDQYDLTEIKLASGITRELASCHTGIIDGYAIEGHVPAEDIKRLLAERPDVAGLSVPGMPLGSPGMEVESGQQDRYDVLTFDRDGNTTVFASH